MVKLLKHCAMSTRYANENDSAKICIAVYFDILTDRFKIMISTAFSFFLYYHIFIILQ